MKIVTLGKLNLFLRHMKQSFTAPFAKADEDGNNIKATYLRKDEFSNAKTADEAKKLSSAHNIGGIPFDGTQDIELPDDNVKKILVGGEEQAADEEKAVKLSEISDDELSLMLDGIKLKGAKCKMSDVYPATYRTMTEPENYLDTSEVTKMDGMFAGCVALESIPWGIDMRSCKSYTGMFSGCSTQFGTSNAGGVRPYFLLY